MRRRRAVHWLVERRLGADAPRVVELTSVGGGRCHSQVQPTAGAHAQARTLLIQLWPPYRARWVRLQLSFLRLDHRC